MELNLSTFNKQCEFFHLECSQTIKTLSKSMVDHFNTMHLVIISKYV